jgi:hypothetical protein
MTQSFREVAAHEIAHFWNADLFSAQRPSPSWLAEGNAELLSLSALMANGRLDAPAATARLEKAASECLLLAGDRAWRDIRERGYGRAPYSCGLMIHFAIVSSARARDPAAGPLSFWSAFWREAPQYSESSLESFLGRVAGADASAALAELLRGKTSLREGARELMRQGHVNMPAREGMDPSTVTKASARVLQILMESDCSGAHGFFGRTDHFEVSGVTGCVRFRTGMKVRYVGERDLVRQPMEVAQDLRASCRDGKAIQVKAIEGEPIELACTPAMAQALPSPASFVTFSASEVAAVLAADKGAAAN